MLKIKNKIPSALIIGGKIVERIKMRNEVVWEKVQSEYFYIESLGDGNTVTLITNLRNTSYSSYLTPTIEYSTDKQNWTTITFDWSTTDVKNINIPVVLNTGDKMYFRNDTGKFSRAIYDGGSYNTSYITFTTDWQGRVNVGGDIRTLINYRNVDNTILEDGMFSNLFSHTYDSNYNAARIVDASNLILPFTQMTPYCYYSMFYGCTPLVNAPALPATTLAWSCYQFMFRGCTSLTTAPTLPATTLASSCYYGMFRDCTSLTTAPELPATTLASNCYQYMFEGCKSLTTAPALPATTLADYCYQYMFSGCTSLTTAPELPATKLEFNCYYSMFSGCTSLTTAPALPATTLVSDCYSSMFDGCTSLTTAPALPATTLADDCYNNMFNGCSNLNKVLTYADDISTSNCTTNWLNNVASSGTLYNAGSAVYTTDSPSGIPTGWTEDTTVPGTTSLYALPNTFTAKSWMDKYKLNYIIMGVNETGIDVPISEQNEFITIGKNTGSSTVTHTETLNYDGWDYTITINQTANDTDEPDYFYIESLGDENTVTVINNGHVYTYNVTPTLEYSTDKNTWDTITFDWTNGNHTTELPIALNTGEKMYFRNDTRKFSDSYGNISFSPSVSSNVGGDIRTLSNYLDVNGETKSQSNMFKNLFYNNKYIVDASNLRLPYTTLAERCYQSMFDGCTPLVNAPALPATTLAYYCYLNMFRDCTSLTTAPALPATTLAERCYNNMFNGCTSLTTAPTLPATTLANLCYDSMFQGCTSLTTAPVLPATTLVNSCYDGMFWGCTSLTTAPALPATTLADSCYSYMFYGCTALTTAPELPATTLAERCYSAMFRDCTSLTTAPTLPDTTLASWCYGSMFQGCTSLTTAPVLPATTLVNSCYDSMFWGCTSLTTAPELPATNLAEGCYSDMFRDCTSLTTAPTLPATTLASWCYGYMFWGCTALTTAPELPATTLVNSCYSQMFYGCTALTTAPALPATTLVNNCYSSMFQGCTSLTTAPELPATTLKNYCYEGMFQGCNSLTSVTIYATSTENNSFDSWLDNVAPSGTVYNNGLVDLPENSASGVPSGWTEIVPEIQSITVNPDTFTIEFNNETVTCNSTLEVVTTMGTLTNTNSATLTVGENTGNTTRTLTETIPYYNSSYDVTIVQSAIQSITANPDTFTIKSYKDTVKCTSTLTITTTLGTTITDTNTATVTVGENTGDTTRTLTETIPYKGSSYQVTIVQTANDVKPAYEWNVESTGTYPFELNTNGYYESTNKGHDSSYSYATLNYQGFENLVLECINFAESKYDYGIISQPDVQLSESTSDDGATGSANVFHNFKGESSTNPVQLTIPSDGGSHFITIKFRKDSSTSQGNDSLQFKVIEP